MSVFKVQQRKGCGCRKNNSYRPPKNVINVINNPYSQLIFKVKKLPLFGKLTYCFDISSLILSFCSGIDNNFRHNCIHYIKIE